MHTTEGSTGKDRVIFEALSEQDAAYLREDRPDGAITLSVGDIDVPAFVSDGRVFVEVPLSGFCETLEPSVSIRFSYLEAGISDTWRTTLPPDSVRCALLGTWLALARMVRNSTEQG